MSSNEPDDLSLPNLTSCQWQTLPSMSAARLQAACVAIDEHRLVIVGGYNESIDGIPIAELYDSRTNSWTAVPNNSNNNPPMPMPMPMPTPRSGCAAVFLGGKMYVMGGWDSNGRTVSTLEALDITTNNNNNNAFQWETSSSSSSSLIPMNQARQDFAAVAIDDHIYVFGGRCGCLDSAERYNTVTGQWEDLPKMPTPRFGCAAAAIGNKIYVVGGKYSEEEGSYSYLASVDVYDVTTQQWDDYDSGSGSGTVVVPDMTTARHRCAAVAVAGRFLVVIGGSVVLEVDDEDDQDLDFDTAELFDTVTQRWIEFPSRMSTPRLDAAAAVLGRGGNIAVCITGGYDGNEYLDSTEQLSLAPLLS